jgi:predicted ATPase
MKVSIKNYKSIRSLEFEARRVNVIIGEPNCGKTNIIEALSLPGLERWAMGPELFRCNKPSELFWDAEIRNKISISVGELRGGLSVAQGQSQEFQFEHPGGSTLVQSKWSSDQRIQAVNAIRRYEFRSTNLFPRPEVKWLLPPYGENLAALLGANRELRVMATDIFAKSGFRLAVTPDEQKVSVMKDLDGILINYSFTSSSETLRRIMFYRLAVETNEKAILLFDEPEANTFPMFTKLFAEQIAADDRGNRFFLTTHSPYLLDSLIEKTPRDELAVILCHMEDFETKARVLKQAEVEQVLDMGASAFFNLDHFTGA